MEAIEHLLKDWKSFKIISLTKKSRTLQIERLHICKEKKKKKNSNLWNHHFGGALEARKIYSPLYGRAGGAGMREQSTEM